jgi:P4 family phage/plasmid primase-like protien
MPSRSRPLARKPKLEMKPNEIKRRVSIDSILRYYGSVQDSKGHWRCLFPERHRNGDANHSVTAKDGRALCWSQQCFGEKGADVFEVVGLKENLQTFADKKRRVCEIGDLQDHGTDRENRRIVATYDYTEEDGTLLFQVVREEPKGFWQRRPDGKGGWIPNIANTRLVLYRLPEVMKATTVLIVEGEKDTDTAFRLGLPNGWAATCNPMGAGKWRPQYADMLTGKRVLILPDADEPGRKHGEQVAQSLTDKAERIDRLTLPGGVKDLSEWAPGKTEPDFTALLAQAMPDVGGSQTKPPTDTANDEDCGLTKWLADRIQRDACFAKDAGGLLYVFENGVYRPTGEAFVCRRVKEILIASGDTKKWSTHRASEVVEFVRVDVPELWECPPVDTINVLNGLLDWKTGALRPLGPNHLSSIQIPVTYDPTATCPNWDRFVEQVFPSDCCVLAYEIIGWLMIPDMSMQKAILLIGEGANGKSVYLKAVTAFLGRENTASLSLQRLESDKFAAARLVGKLANICADLPSEHLAGTSVFKAIVGGDPLLGERKFQGSFEFLPFCRLVFSANHYPQSKDSSAAFFRRWVVIPFERTFAPSEQISRAVLDAQLADPSELSGVLNRALESLRALRTRGGFTQSETTSAAALEFASMTEPVSTWLDHFTDPDPAGMVSRKDLMIVYNASAEANGRPALSPKAFCSAVRRLRPTVQDAQRTICGSVQWVFLGLRLKETTSQNRTGRGTDGSRLSRDSHHFPQISREDIQEDGTGEREEKIKIGNAVNHVNEGLFTEGPEEVVSDDN